MKPQIDLDAYFDLDSGVKDNATKKHKPFRVKDRQKNQTDDGLPGQAAVQYRSVRVKKILVPEEKRAIDHDLANSIAESAKVIGFVRPIAVRAVTLNGKNWTVLVAGAHQLEAARYLGYERIDCKFINSNDDQFIELVQIGEDLFRKQLHVLRRNELIMRWYELATENRISGQDGRKRTRGRPRGGDSEIARSAPFAETFHAQRKIIQRAKKIAGITPEAKQAAIEAGLDDNQKALLAIAGTSGPKGQRQKVAALAKSTVEDTEATATADAATETNESDVCRRRRSDPEPSQPDTTFEQMVELWTQHCRRSWKYLPKPERERFIGKLGRAPCKAHRDVVAFVADVFTGRQDVFADDLYRLAKKRGIPKKFVRTILKYKRYVFKRRRDDKRAYYRQRTTDWKNEYPKISDAELTGEQPRGGDYYDRDSGEADKVDDEYYRS